MVRKRGKTQAYKSKHYGAGRADSRLLYTFVLKIKARVRYNQKEQDATATMENGLLHVVFDEPQRAISKGQSVVLYDGDTVIGGGRII